MASSFAVSSLPYTGLSQKFVGVQDVSIYQRAGYVPFRLSGSNYPTADDGKIELYFYFDTKLASIQNSTYLVANEYYFGDGYIYKWTDLERFAFFDKAALEILQHLDFKPDLLIISVVADNIPGLVDLATEN